MGQKGWDKTIGREGESKIPRKMSINTHSERENQKEMMYILYVPFTQHTTARAIESFIL